MKAAALSVAMVVALGLKSHATDPRFEVTGFTKVQSNSGVDVTVVEGPAFRIEAYAKRGPLSRLEIDKHGDVLVIDRKITGVPGTFWKNGRRDQFEVIVALPELEGVEALSGSSLEATIEHADDFYAYVAQGASLEVVGLNAEDIDASARSGASLFLSGSCGDLEVEARSGASVSATKLTCQRVDAESRSGASINAFAVVEARGDARSGASLVIAGKPATHDLSTRSGGSAYLN